MSVDEACTRVRALLSNSQLEEAMELIDTCAIDVKTSPPLWELKIIVLDKLGCARQALAAAEEYVSRYENEETHTVNFLNAEPALILGDGALKYNDYASAYRWYKLGMSATEDDSVLLSLNRRLLIARSSCARKGLKEVVEDED